MKKSFFSITIGANDFLNNYLLPVLSIGARITQGPDAFVDDMINHLRDQLMRLYRLDTRKFVVGNIGPLDCIPYQKTINQLNENELKDLLTQLRSNLPVSTFVHANVYDLVREFIINYEKYGFTKSSRACCGNGGQFAGIVPCGPTSSMCQDRDKHVFWDPCHPSEASNLIISKQLLDGERKYISPVNLIQLRDV
ncbi:hypothetical protein Dsin_009269 [Dipteronia sinensis]|uniref:GDSL esterase/lipase n=1 Tax=Dipteronia sinensis TaxID=43782 RepID=A0AAE0ARI0_9ROSI|nr:hypothetical protein Dsin_009269 [Dipteronia sinensis]